MIKNDIPEKSLFDFSKDKIENFGDLVFKISPFVYRLFKNYIPNRFYNIKYFFQRTFRSYHAADIDLWDLDYHLAKIILPKLIAFKKANTHGYPNAFSDYDEDCGVTKEEYEKGKAEGYYVGGGYEAWHKVIDEMIFGFEYVLVNMTFSKKEEQFYEKYGYKYPYRETDDNLAWSYNYVDNSNNSIMCTSELLDTTLDKNKNYTVLSKERFYYDSDVQNEVAKRANKGIEYFGKYFMNLWD
jgi:hypothetical protein